mgnify:CR=1 FL=1
MPGRWRTSQASSSQVAHPSCATSVPGCLVTLLPGDQALKQGRRAQLPQPAQLSSSIGGDTAQKWRSDGVSLVTPGRRLRTRHNQGQLRCGSAPCQGPLLEAGVPLRQRSVQLHRLSGPTCKTWWSRQGQHLQQVQATLRLGLHVGGKGHRR